MIGRNTYEDTEGCGAWRWLSGLAVDSRITLLFGSAASTP